MAQYAERTDLGHRHRPYPRKRKQSIFKLLKRRGIEQVKALGEGARGQAISYISQHDYEQLLPELSSTESDFGQSVEAEPTPGVFYLIQLEPEHDPGRFKIGFASNIDERLRSHRTAAPLCQLVKTWPCQATLGETPRSTACVLDMSDCTRRSSVHPHSKR